MKDYAENAGAIVVMQRPIHLATTDRNSRRACLR
jgi:hypothetical protein